MRQRPDFILIGKIRNAHGIKGEVVVIPITDDVEQFTTLKEIVIQDKQGKRHFLAIERARFQRDRVILKLATIDDRTAAEHLRGRYIEKRREDCPPLPEGEFYIFDLIGLNVRTTNDVWLGKLVDVMTLPANDVFVVQGDDQEYLIPVIKSVIKSVDLEQELIIIEPIAGLL